MDWSGNFAKSPSPLLMKGCLADDWLAFLPDKPNGKSA